MVTVSDFFLVPMFFYCFFTPQYRPFRFFNGVRRSFLMRATHDDFSVLPFGGVLLVIIVSMVLGYYFRENGGVMLSSMRSLFYGFLLVFVLVFVLRVIAFLVGKVVGKNELFNLVVFSLFLPVSLAIWLGSKGVGGLIGLLLLYSFVCIFVSYVRILRA